MRAVDEAATPRHRGGRVADLQRTMKAARLPSMLALFADRRWILVRMGHGSAVPAALAVFAGYYVLGQAAIRLTIMPEGIVTFWPPNAVVVAALLLYPVRHWWLLVAAGIAAEIVADLGHFPLWQIAAFGVVNAVEATLAAAVIRWSWLDGRRFTEFTVRGAMICGITFLFVATPVAALGGAAIYVGGDPSIPYWEFWRLWWFGDATGLLVMTPLFLVWLGEPVADAIRAPGRRVELTALGVLLCAGAGLVFLAPLSWPAWASAPSLLLPLLAWAAVRFGMHGATAAMVLVAFAAAAGTTGGRGPFIVDTSPTTTVLNAQEYLLAAVVLALSLGATFRELTRTMRALRAERGSLEERIEERTRALREATRNAEQLALKDDLTGTDNRRAFFERGRAVHAHAVRHRQPYSMIMLDIDYFKHVNDTYGHSAGDAVLQCVANTIGKLARASDIAGRFGGDEFAICLPDCGLEEGRVLAERICREIHDSPIPWRNETLRITCSIGVAEQQPGDTSVDAALVRADDALYRAKREGRDRIAVTRRPAA